jgi:hypothetical protein
MKHKSVALLVCATLLVGCHLFPANATPTPTLPLAEIILVKVLTTFDRCMSDAGIVVEGNSYSFFCRNSADTGYIISMAHYDNKEAANEQLESIRGENPLECFNGYPLYETRSKNSFNRYIVIEHLAWQADSWLIKIDASYDYGYFHYTARGFADELYTSSVEHGLFTAGICP